MGRRARRSSRAGPRARREECGGGRRGGDDVRSHLWRAGETDVSRKRAADKFIFDARRAPSRPRGFPPYASCLHSTPRSGAQGTLARQRLRCVLPFDHLVRFARVPARFRRRSARRAASNIGVGSESWTFRGQMPRGARDRDPAGHDAFRAAIARRARFDSPVDARPALRGPSRDPRRASRAFTRIDGWTARPPRGVTRTSRNEYAATSRSARF